METEKNGSKARDALITRGQVVACIQQDASSCLLWWEDDCWKLVITAISLAIGKGSEVIRLYALRILFLGGDKPCAWLDYEEIDELITAISILKDSMIHLRTASPESKNVYYCSRDNLCVGFRQQPGSSDQITYFEFTSSKLKLTLCQARKVVAVQPPAPVGPVDTPFSAEMGETTSIEWLNDIGSPSDFDNLAKAIIEGKELLDVWRCQGV